jgi:tetratricopeptide (TPR) repeat protein
MTDPELDAHLTAARAAAVDDSCSPQERTEMLTAMAMALQNRPRSSAWLDGAIALYDLALTLCPADDGLLRARLSARRATALQMRIEDGTQSLHAARAAVQAAIPDLESLGTPEECAEAELNLGLVIQSLAGFGEANLRDAIAAYHRALRTFDSARFPVEFAILQNNLATALLALPVGDEQGRMREALAVQAFEEGLKAVTLKHHPAEYAMLQNNLGNALQYASSSHAIENNLRALEAYDAALKVRTRRSSPLEYANTIANKANCLRNLPDDPKAPERGGDANLTAARGYYQEALDLFSAHGDHRSANLVAEALAETASPAGG